MYVLVGQRDELRVAGATAARGSKLRWKTHALGVLDEHEPRVGPGLFGAHQLLAVLVGTVVGDDAGEVLQCLATQRLHLAVEQPGWGD